MTMNTPHTRTGTRNRRGVAMMLVIVAVAMGTVIAAAALTMNDKASAIGQNAVASSKAKWTARSASETVVAAMQTETDWASIMSGDTLMNDWSVGGSNVDVSVTNLSGGPATIDDREILVNVTTDAGTISEKIIKQVSRAPEAIFGGEIDTGLGEFGIYTTDQIMINSDARVQVWPMSPEAKLRPAVRIGARDRERAQAPRRRRACLGRALRQGLRLQQSQEPDRQ